MVGIILEQDCKLWCVLGDFIAVKCLKERRGNNQEAERKYRDLMSS